MSDGALLLRFSEDDVADGERLLGSISPATVTTLTPSQALRELRGGAATLRGRSQLGVVGRPPEAGIGYSVAPIVAALASPDYVTSIDAERRRVTRRPTPRYLLQALPGAAAQLGSSALAVGAQNVAARALERSGVAPARRTTTPRRVLYIRPLVGVPTSVGGAITHTHGVIRAMRELGLEVDAITTDESIADTARRDPSPACEWRTVPVPRAFRALPASVGLGGDMALAATGLRSARAADLIYQRHARFSVVGALLARASGAPLVLEYNGSEAFFEGAYDATPFARQLELCETAILATAAVIVVTSEVDRDNLVERGLPAERVVLNPNGVDAERFDRGGGPEVRRRLGLSDGDPLLGFVGSYGPWHGTLALADAFVAVAAEDPRARLLLVGDGPERPDVLERLRRAGVLDRAIVTGKLAPADVPAHLDACDVLVSPHIPMPGGVEFFGSPTKLFEYMAAGRAIVASRLGQIGDVLDHERSALLVTPADVDELAAAIRRLIGDPALRERLGAEARRDAVELHSWRANVERTLAAFRDWAAR